VSAPGDRPSPAATLQLKLRRELQDFERATVPDAECHPGRRDAGHVRVDHELKGAGLIGTFVSKVNRAALACDL